MARKRQESEGVQGDMTPMIDMVFQLLIFFMILINFADADQNARVKLPENDIVKPPEQPIPDAVTLQIARQEKKKNEYSVLIGAEEFFGDKDLKRLKAALDKEVKFVKNEKKKSAKDMTIILRADKDAPIGFINRVIHTCQEADIETFALRATAKVK
ncbi:MAG: biopolymer transporter ExbD [Thermoguttaceae bacterium]|nr:biopolymer transporter ExbD [Thermoguttaceae bacterium]MDO4856867.1 biopolymer transporter ExbD [Thermoguttaceae bacterium]